MNIQYYGHSCFKITVKPAGRGAEDVIIFTDPFDKSIGFRPPQGNANILFISHNHPGHNNISIFKNNPLIIEMPGEYSVKGINIVGIDSFHDKKNGEALGRNTIFVAEAEGIRFCHLGDLGNDLTAEQSDQLGEIDILFIPIGGETVLDDKAAEDLIGKIEPKIIIPMHCKEEKTFCARMGNCPKDKAGKISFKKKDIMEENKKIILMSVE